MAIRSNNILREIDNNPEKLTDVILEGIIKEYNESPSDTLEYLRYSGYSVSTLADVETVLVKLGFDLIKTGRGYRIALSL